MNAHPGLSEEEAAVLLRRDGPNRLPPPQHKTFLAALLSVMVQPMVLLLFACTVLYAVLGSTTDSVVLGLSIVGVAAISVYQELRTQRVLEALRDLASPRSTVVRGGIVRRIASQDLVAGDHLIVQEGDRMACDAHLLEANGLRVDESLLTGESVPIDKGIDLGHHGSDRLHAGTLVVQGDGAAIVEATGIRTTLGRIGGMLASIEPRPSRLHEQLVRLVRAVAFLAVLTCVFAASVFAWRDGSWTAGLLVGLTLAMAIIPEEFAVVWTVMLALGAWRLARANVLTRQPQAVEALGAATVLCVDKTGTLTCNRMTVAAVFDGRDEGSAADVRFAELLRIAALASTREGIEPMDQAIFRVLSGQDLPEPSQVRGRTGVLPGRPFVTQTWRLDGESDLLIAIKGAPEAVLSRCSDPPARLQALASRATAWAAEGKRVIAVALARRVDAKAPPEAGWSSVGLLAFEDPIRDDVRPALEECRQAGVRVMMMTGDAAETALAIARAAGLISDDVLTGSGLDAMSEAELELAIRRVAVFARVSPAHKLRIVQALQRRGEVVAMTGDGVNDGPALRAADVGVAMGERGTDVAREAAAIVLLDDRFSSLVEGVRAGRRIFANLQRAMGYLFAVHVPIVGLSLLPLFGGPVLLLPIHVVLLELIIDPACSLVFEAEPASDREMRVPPRSGSTPLFSVSAVARSLAVGAVALVALVIVQWAGHVAALSEDALRLAGLVTIVVGNFAMLQWFRGGFTATAHPNRAFDGLVLAVCVLGGMVLLVSPLRAAFGLPLEMHPPSVFMLLGAPAAWAVWRLVRKADADAPPSSTTAT